MDTVMEEKRGTYTALSLSLALHVILLLAAGTLGLFSIAVPQTGDTPVEVTLYDAGSPATAAAGDSAAAPAVSAVSDVVIVDKTLPPETPQETPKQTSNPQTSATSSKPSDGTQTGTVGSSGSSGGGDTAGTGSKGGTSGTSGGGDAAPAAPPAPPAERVEASLRAEATPEYPQELIEDDVECSVPQTARSSPLGSSPPPATVRWIARRLRRGIAFSSTRGTMDAGAFGRSHFGSGWSRA